MAKSYIAQAKRSNAVGGGAGARVISDQPEAGSQLIDEELRLGLAANGLETITFDEASDPGGADALYAPAASPEALSALETRGIPILTDTEASDMDRIAALLQVGVAEAVPRPVRPDELARRAWRAIQRSRRSRRQG